MGRASQNSKEKRHDLILKLIADNEVRTQTELSELVNAAGFNATQATISRDIKKLRLIKTADTDSTYKYIIGTDEEIWGESRKYISVLIQVVIKVAQAQNFAIVNTLPGTANAAAAAIDSLKWDEVLGSLAGDDTIFIAFASPEKALLFCTRIEGLINEYRQ
ncbi:Arginine repressor [bioreactor metagenome]|uniref:Arginine repressor n=1 Tax=bioreactor metagenome TaxID=1076179 RepID=A0A645CKP2_9ZZZZ